MYELVLDRLYSIQTVETSQQSAIIKTLITEVTGNNQVIPIVFEGIPAKQDITGKVTQLQYIDGYLEWVYLDAPQSTDERVTLLETALADRDARLADIELALAEIFAG